MIRLGLPLCLAGAAAAGVVTTGFYGYSWLSGAGGAPIIWKAHHTTMYASNDSLGPTSPAGQQFRAAVAAWGANPKSDFRFFVHDGDHDAVVGDLDGFNDCYFAFLGHNVMGIAYMYSDATDTVMWDCDIAFSNYHTFGFYYDFQTVAVHELGHALGLMHSSDFNAAMWAHQYMWVKKPEPRADDLAGQQFLYPKPVPGAGPWTPEPGQAPPPLPVRTGTMSALAVSAEEVLVGDSLTFTATVTNASGGDLLLSTAQTTPSSTGSMDGVLLGAGEVRGFALERTVTDLPGLYPIRLLLGGVDSTMAYVAQQSLPGTTVRVRRPTIPLALQDDVFASLGPRGAERVELFLARGQEVMLELATSADRAGGCSMRLLDPAGEPVRSWKSGRPAKARASGVHSLVIENTGDAKRTYTLATECRGRPPAVRGMGALDGAGPAEATFLAWARTTATIALKGSRKLAPRIVSLRSPSGATVEVPDGAEVAIDEFGEDGVWTAVVEGAAGVSGKFRIQARPTWLEGMDVTR